MIRHGILADDGVTLLAKFVTPVDVHSNNPIFSVDALSLKRHVHQRTAQRWEVEGNLEPLTFGAHKLMTVFVKKGQNIPFKILMPQNYGVMRAMTASGTATVSGSAGSSTITIAGAGGLIPEGTFVKFASHNKVYMIMSDTSGGSVEIFPKLRQAATGAMSYREVVLHAYRDQGGVRGMRFEEGILMDYGSVRFVEAL